MSSRGVNHRVILWCKPLSRTSSAPVSAWINDLQKYHQELNALYHHGIAETLRSFLRKQKASIRWLIANALHKKSSENNILKPLYCSGYRGNRRGDLYLKENEHLRKWVFPHPTVVYVYNFGNQTLLMNSIYAIMMLHTKGVLPFSAQNDWLMNRSGKPSCCFLKQFAIPTLKTLFNFTLTFAVLGCAYNCSSFF